MVLYHFKPLNLDYWSIRRNKYEDEILNCDSIEDKTGPWLLPNFVCQTISSVSYTLSPGEYEIGITLKRLQSQGMRVGSRK